MQARLSPGTQLEVRVVDGRIEIEPARLRVRVHDVDGVTVAEPEGTIEPLTSDLVNEVLDSLRG
jgi:hypothetical protein